MVFVAVADEFEDAADQALARTVNSQGQFGHGVLRKARPFAAVVHGAEFSD
jgi:hypothetical protein